MNCYSCIHRGEVVGSCHSRCNHPAIGGDVMGLAMTLGMLKPKFVVVGDERGIKKGWFCWPINFDPVWLIECGGYEQKSR